MASISGQSTSNISGVDGFFTTQGGGGGTASTTPTIAVSGGTFGAISIVISNHSSYTNPNYFVESKVGATVTVADSDVTRQLDPSSNHIGDTLTFTDSNASTSQRTITEKPKNLEILSQVQLLHQLILQVLSKTDTLEFGELQQQVPILLIV